MAIAEAEVQPEVEERTIYPGMPITEYELMRLPRDGRKWEMEDGWLTAQLTQFFHDAIGINLIGLLLPYTRGRGFMSSGSAGFHTADDSIRAPDVSYTRKERFPGGHAPDEFGDLAPDLCVEIISPFERKAGIMRKVREYFSTGAVQVWHVFPERQEVIVFTSPTDTQTLGADGVLPGFSCRVADLLETE